MRMVRNFKGRGFIVILPVSRGEVFLLDHRSDKAIRAVALAQ